ERRIKHISPLASAGVILDPPPTSRCARTPRKLLLYHSQH
uniref:Uncharacterized protein n=1 Tax=Aegilops tauschii subsp. strangulata TaxID=200361 RepID=A0A453P7E2_AEGTS